MYLMIYEETLWNQMKFLYPSMTLDEFHDTVNLEGIYDTITRININLKNRYEMMEKYGGDGLGRYRELYREFKSGELDRRIERLNSQKRRLRKLLNEKG